MGGPIPDLVLKDLSGVDGKPDLILKKAIVWVDKC